jgi:hypothetical protein
MLVLGADLLQWPVDLAGHKDSASNTLMGMPNPYGPSGGQEKIPSNIGLAGTEWAGEERGLAVL